LLFTYLPVLLRRLLEEDFSALVFKNVLPNRLSGKTIKEFRTACHIYGKIRWPVKNTCAKVKLFIGSETFASSKW
jgi:hypothetical protein